MAITVASNFDQTAAVPLDSRTVVADSTARDAIASGVRYEGLTVYVVADAKNYQLIGGIANGDWTELQGAGGGGINYILAPDGTDITGWAAYADAAGTSPVDGTGGSPATTFAVSTDSSLVGTENFVWTKSAADRQGEGFGYAFSIDAAFKSKPITISALYRVDSGTFADNDMTVWVLDVTNSVLIQPSAYQIKNTTGVEQIKCEFQAASNSTSYRLIFHTASTSAVAYTLRFDSFSVSPNTYNSGAVVTEPVAYTPTFTGFGTVTGVNVRSWRVGKILKVQGTFTAGTPTATEARITFGFGGVNGGITSDSGLPTLSSCGAWGINVNGAATDATLMEANVGYMTFGHGYTSGSYLSKANGNLVVGTGSVMSFFGEFPIQGWGTSQVLSSDTDTRVASTSVSSASNTAVGTSPAIFIFDTKTTDLTGSYSTSTGLYTVSTPGEYDVAAKLTTTGVNLSTSQFITIFLYKNGSIFRELSRFKGTGVSTNAAPNGGTTVTCVAGDTLAIWAISDVATTTTSGSPYTYATFARKSGPAQIAASEKIRVLYTGNAGAANTADVTNVDFITKVVDSHGAWNGTTFTAPRADWYDFKAMIFCTTSASRSFSLFVGGSKTYYMFSVPAAGTSMHGPGATGVYLLAGQTATIRLDTNGTLSNNAVNHWVAITSQG